MLVHLPIAEIDINIFFLIFVSSLAGIMSGLFGLGGGMIINPLMIFAGIPAEVVIGTAPMQLLGTSFASTIVGYTKKRIDLTIGFPVAIFSILGAIIGSFTLKELSVFGQFDSVISVIYIALMISVSFVLTKGVFLNANQVKEKAVSDYTVISNAGKFNVFCERSGVYVNLVSVAFLALGVGFVGSICGIGGSIFIVPFLISLYKVPMRVASSTVSMQIFAMSCFTLIIYGSFAMMDVVLGSFLILFSSIFVRLGVKIQDILGPEIVKFLMLIVCLSISAVFLSKLFIEPHDIFKIEM